jgi:hypothetical protein
VLQNSYVTYSDTFARPGGGDWTLADLSSLRVSIVPNGAANWQARVSQLYMTVNYTAPNTYYAFSQSSASAAVAASGVQLNPKGMHLSWTNNDTNAYAVVIERSKGDALHFMSVGAAVAGTASWDDPDISSGTRYYYRVRTINGFGNSAVSPIVSAQATRDADLLIQGDTFDNSSTLWTYQSGGIMRDPLNNQLDYGAVNHMGYGDWVEFSNVNFTGQETHLQLNTGNPNPGSVELWIDGKDAASGGTLLGTYNIPATNGYDDYRMTPLFNFTSISAGKHDIFLKVPDTIGFGNLAWFQFS